MVKVILLLCVGSAHTHTGGTRLGSSAVTNIDISACLVPVWLSASLYLELVSYSGILLRSASSLLLLISRRTLSIQHNQNILLTTLTSAKTCFLVSRSSAATGLM